MLYYLAEYLQQGSEVPGVRLMTYITFRSGAAFLLALVIALVIGRKIIDRLQMMQIGETIRDLGLEGQLKKQGTPTMGGIIIILSLLVPCLLVGNLSNIYMLLMIIATVWCGTIGFLDDYLKIKKHNKDGMKGRFKIVGQIGLGLLVGLTMCLSPDVTQRQVMVSDSTTTAVDAVADDPNESDFSAVAQYTQSPDMKSTQTTIPFVKGNNFDYASLTSWMGKYAQTGGWILFVIVVIVAVTATSNGANLTDGLDGLCAGVSAVICSALAIMAYLGGNLIYSTYLNIMYIPGSSELVVFISALMGALIGFLWYNANPAQVFMGDTGSLTLGGIIAVFAILIHKELLIPLLCLVFFAEDLSVIIQTAYFKYTKKKYGAGRRIFRMAPLHHHFQKEGIAALLQIPRRAMAEPKIVTRFWIVSILCAVLTFITLKIR